MPLTPLQKEVLLLLARHRNPDSHMAGGAVINRADYKKEDYYSQKYYKYYGTVPGRSKPQPIQGPRINRWRFADTFGQSPKPPTPPEHV